LAEHPVTVVDVEQVVIRGRLVLAVLLTAPRDEVRLRRAVAAVADELGMDVEVAAGAGGTAAPRRSGRSHVTVLGHPLRPTGMSAIAGRIADSGANIDRITRVADYPVTAIELEASGTDPDQLRA